MWPSCHKSIHKTALEINDDKTALILNIALDK